MLLTPGYVVIVHVLVKSSFIHTFRSRLFVKRLTFSRVGWHVLRDFRQDVLRRCILRNVSLLYVVSVVKKKNPET